MRTLKQHRSLTQFALLALCLSSVLVGCGEALDGGAGAQNTDAHNGIGPDWRLASYIAGDRRSSTESAYRSEATAAASLDALLAWERADAGVPATAQLHGGPMHGDTPNRIPGAQVITTKGLLPLLSSGTRVLVFDVLGSERSLPNAIPAAWAAQPGSFYDATQHELAQLLRSVTHGDLDVPLVFYCGGPQCWMSYNASLRATHLGYRNVLWYRGGVEAWSRAEMSFGSAG